MPNPFPEYERPPLEEVAAGIQFEPLQGFRAAHLGLYWSRIRARYPFTEDQAPLAHSLEQPSRAPALTQFSLQSNLPLPRCWFLDPSKTQFVQLQADRFVRNWRRVEGTEQYPRFTQLKSALQDEWAIFLKFVEDEGLGTLKANQCELTYVNHLEPGIGWTSLSEVPKVFSPFRLPEGQQFLPPAETTNWQIRYKFPDGRGRLYVDSAPVFRGRDFKLTLSLNLSARGAPNGTTTNDLFAWFDLAHEWIVRGFDELTSTTMHEHWGKKP